MVKITIEKDDDHQRLDRFLRKYFNRIENKLHINNETYIVSNRIAEAIIEKYIDIAKAKGIDFQVEGCFPEIDEIEPYDICTIFDNLIKNSIEAAEKTVEKHMISAY